MLCSFSCPLANALICRGASSDRRRPQRRLCRDGWDLRPTALPVFAAERIPRRDIPHIQALLRRAQL